jgi:hypothetical protein
MVVINQPVVVSDNKRLSPLLAPMRRYKLTQADVNQLNRQITAKIEADYGTKISVRLHRD